MEEEVEEKLIVDVSQHFWSFVELILSTNGSDEIRTQESYLFFGDLIESEVSIRADVLLQIENYEGIYSFENFNYLFYSARTILRRHNKFSLAQKVQQAIDIMCIQIEMEQSMADLTL